MTRCRRYHRPSIKRDHIEASGVVRKVRGMRSVLIQLQRTEETPEVKGAKKEMRHN